MRFSACSCGVGSVPVSTILLHRSEPGRSVSVEGLHGKPPTADRDHRHHRLARREVRRVSAAVRLREERIGTVMAAEQDRRRQMRAVDGDDLSDGREGLEVFCGSSPGVDGDLGDESRIRGDRRVPQRRLAQEPERLPERLLRGGVQRLGRGTADRTWTTSTAIAPLRMALIDHISVAVVKCAA